MQITGGFICQKVKENRVGSEIYTTVNSNTVNSNRISKIDFLMFCAASFKHLYNLNKIFVPYMFKLAGLYAFIILFLMIMFFIKYLKPPNLSLIFLSFEPKLSFFSYCLGHSIARPMAFPGSVKLLQMAMGR